MNGESYFDVEAIAEIEPVVREEEISTIDP
jgi:hypothetical protein